MSHASARLTRVLITVLATTGCGDHTALTGPDAEVAVLQVQARVAADDGDTDERLPLIYLDGERIHDAPKAVLRALSPADVERLEVVMGCRAVRLLGPDAREGVIVVYTKAYEGDSLEFEEKYPELGDACRREFQRERARALAERKGDDWPPTLEPIVR